MNLAELRSFKPQILQLANRYGVGHIRVSGSVARGDADESSDVDLLVDGFNGSLFGFVALKRQLEDLLRLEVDLVQIDAVKNPLRRRYMLEDATDL